MPEYRRYDVSGGTYSFTVVTHAQAPILCDSTARAILRAKFPECRKRWPFALVAIVLLPDHLHSIWTLPEGDHDYSMRWAWIKKEFTKEWLRRGGDEGKISEARRARRRRGVWQPRYWEHSIFEEDDFENHFHYVHYNPVKHGLVRFPCEWPYFSFHRWVKAGVYNRDWCCTPGALPVQDMLDTTGE
jgi:REP-associated tyrosine transposase